MKVSKELEARILAQAGVGKTARRPRAAKKLAAGWAVELTLPCVVLSEANQRCHWAVRKKRFDLQRTTLLAVCAEAPLPGFHHLPVRVTFTHVGRRMDSDNLAGAFKALRDELAETVFGVDDGDDGVEWRYEQRPGGTPGVVVRIEGKP